MTHLTERYAAVTAESLATVVALANARVDIMLSPALLNVDIFEGVKLADPHGIEANFRMQGEAARIPQLRESTFRLTEHATHQFASLFQMTPKHFDWAHTVGGNGDLADYLNTLLHKPGRFTTPTLFRFLIGERFAGEGYSGKIRGLLSNSYGMIDACDLSETLMGEVNNRGAEIVSAFVTEHGERSRFQLCYPAKAFKIENGKIITPPADWKPGMDGKFFKADRWMVPTTFLSCGETGGGAVTVESGVTDSFCTNGAVLWKCAGKIHRVKRTVVEGMAWSDDTRKKQLTANIAECRDAIADANSDANIASCKEKMALAQGVQLPKETVCVLSARIIKASDAKAQSENLLALLTGRLPERATRFEAATLLNSVEAAAIYRDETVLQEIAGEVMLAAAPK